MKHITILIDIFVFALFILTISVLYFVVSVVGEINDAKNWHTEEVDHLQVAVRNK